LGWIWQHTRRPGTCSDSALLTRREVNPHKTPVPVAAAGPEFTTASHLNAR